VLFLLLRFEPKLQIVFLFALGKFGLEGMGNKAQVEHYSRHSAHNVEPANSGGGGDHERGGKDKALAFYLWLKINGRMKQNGNTNLMIFKIPTLIESVSSVMTLEEGDLILTGTPEGVGPVVEGDEVEAGIDFNSKSIVNMKFTAKNRTYSKL